MNSALNKKPILILTIFLLLFVYIGINFKSAASSSSISKKFATNQILVEGELVSSTDQNRQVVKADVNNIENFEGVIQTSNRSLVEISNSESGVQVAVSGEVLMLVSDINGEVQTGDLLTISWISGVAMKADKDSKYIIGKALKNYELIQTETIEDVESPNGEKVRATIGLLDVNLEEIVITDNEQNTGLSGFIEQLVGKEITSTRLLLGFLIILGGLSLLTVFLNSSIRGSFLAFGRNPLASSSIFTGLVQTSFLSVGILLLTILIAYMVWVI